MPSSKKKGAAHPDNQDMLDRLKDLAAKPYYESNPNYSRMFSRARTSLANHTLPITSREELMQLKGIGNWISEKLFPSGKSSGNKVPGKKKRKMAAEKKLSTVPENGGDSSDECGKKESKGGRNSLDTTPSLAFEMLKPKILSHEDAEKLLTTKLKRSYQSDGRNVTSEKQFDYTRAVAYGEKVVRMLHEFTNWKVVLLIDIREQNRDDVQSKLLQSGVTCEQRQLPIGDMLWITRGMHKDDIGRTLEIVLGTVIERKTAEDLASSIFGTRFAEQRLRLKYSAEGANQVIYLCEARSLRNDAGACPAGTLRSALVETMIQMGFSIVKTRNESDTVKWLRRMHLRITRRCFPDQCKTWTGPLLSPEVRRNRNGPEGQIFRHPPINWENDRHHTYEEFECKLRFIRESNTQTAQSLYQAQMKQIPTFDRKKISAITREYPTESHLSDAYSKITRNKGLRDSVDLVKAIKTGKGFRQTSVGPKSSLELHYAYNCCVGEDLTISLSSKKKKRNLKDTDEGPSAPAAVAKALVIDQPLDSAVPIFGNNENNGSGTAKDEEEFVFWDDPNADDSSEEINNQVFIRSRSAKTTFEANNISGCRGSSNQLDSPEDSEQIHSPPFVEVRNSSYRALSSDECLDFDVKNRGSEKHSVGSASIPDIRQRASYAKSFDLTQNSSDGENEEQLLQKLCSSSSQTMARDQDTAKSRKLHNHCIIELSDSESDDDADFSVDSKAASNNQKQNEAPRLPVMEADIHQRLVIEESGLSQTEAIEIH